MIRLGFAFFALSRLPLSWLHGLGAVLGRVVLASDATYRQRLRENLSQAGLDGKDHASASAAEAGKSALELAYVWLRPAAKVLARVGTRDWHLVEQAQAAGRGIIFITPHLGCFEITAQYYAGKADGGAPITVLYREPRKSWLAPLMRRARARPNLALAATDLGGVRKLARALKRGEAVGLLPDQVPHKGEGVWAPFFGKPAYTMTLPARLQQMSGATILLAHGERLAGGAGWVVHLHAFDHVLHGDAIEQATQINTALEAVIRLCPDQYYWGYNRYKQPA